MVLSDRYGGKPKAGVLKRTLLYVVAFGLGSLLLAAGLSFAMVSLAEGLLPGAPGAARSGQPASEGEAPVIIGAKGKGFRTPVSKARRSRGNEGADPTEAVELTETAEPPETAE
jgi:hypothetical protein